MTLARPVPTPTRARGGRDLAAGAAALIGLVLLVVGLPTALLTLGGAPLPALPWSLDAAAAALTRPDDGTLLLQVLLAVVWAAWALFTVAVAAEILARARHTTVPRLPAGALQRLAAHLVTTAAVSLSAGTPLMLAPAAHATPAAQLTQPGPAGRRR